MDPLGSHDFKSRYPVPDELATHPDQQKLHDDVIARSRHATCQARTHECHANGNRQQRSGCLEVLWSHLAQRTESHQLAQVTAANSQVMVPMNRSRSKRLATK